MSESERKPKRKKQIRPAITLREINFAQHYAEFGIASNAYKAAGFPECTTASLWTLAARVLRKPAVQELIHSIRTEAIDSARVTITRIAQGLSRAAFADLRKLFGEHGELKPPCEWPDDLALAIDGVDSEDTYETRDVYDDDLKKTVKRKVLVGHTRKVRLAKRLEALRILAQWRKMIGADAELEAMSREIEQLRLLLTRHEVTHGTTETGA